MKSDIHPDYHEITAMAYDVKGGKLYAADQRTFSLLEIDPRTGNATRIGNFGYGPVNSLAAHPSTGVLYAGLGVSRNQARHSRTVTPGRLSFVTVNL